MQEDIERINRKMQELFEDIQGVPEKLLRNTRQKLFERAGTDFAAFGRMKGQTGIDPYRILGLDKSASDKEVEEAYRQLVFIYHPDKSGTQKTRFAFQMVMLAYELIKGERGGGD